jgi:mono/diheme cytochrome c family protein
MKLTLRSCVPAVALLLQLSPQHCRAQGTAEKRVEIPAPVVAFFKQHCIKCHATDATESEFKIDRTLQPRFQDPTFRAKWNEIVDVLNSHSMPPEEEPQPQPAQVAQVVDWITGQVVDAEKSLRENNVVMRRLNRIEYRNTVKELTGVDVDISSFPQDPLAGGFDNVGSALTFSPMQMELYLETAQRVMDQAIVEGDQPLMIRWRFEIDSGDSDSNRVEVDGQRPIVNGGNNRVVDGFKFVHHDNWDKKLNVRDFAMTHPGNYAVRVRAAGRVPSRAEVVDSANGFLQHRLDEQLQNNPKGEQWHRKQFDSDLQHFRTDWIYNYGPARLKIVQDLGGQPKTVAEYDVPQALDDPQVHETIVPFSTQKAGVTVEYAYSIPSVLENFWLQTGDKFARPELFVDWIELEGPIHPVWPPHSHALLMPEPITTENEQTLAEITIGKFVRRAFRRPITRDEAAPYIDVYHRARGDGQSIVQSIRSALAAVLISPNFLYIVESPRESSGTSRLSSHELASRLAYFLWSGPPDAALLQTADKSQLMSPEVLQSQFERMLLDDRSEQLVQNFSEQWLGLRQVGSNPPAPDLYPHYDRHLELSMIEEGKALFRTILRGNQNVLDFIDPAYVVINERLARFYEIEHVTGDEFRKVPIAVDHPRAGILSHTAMLTITSNGTRTSPVKRGTWVLTNVLGTDPGLPVANAGDIAPKVPGIDKATVRKRLEIHRELPQCARCHDKIDPLGLALENFNASGQFRSQEGFGYKGRIEADDPTIDASARLPDGTKINGPVELRRALRKQADQFLVCLAQKLMTYALGREITLADQPVLKQVVQQTKQGDYRLSEMLKAIVLSDAFLSH